MDWDFWLILLRFLWKRDSASAFGLVIWLELFLDTDDLSFTANFLRVKYKLRREDDCNCGTYQRYD